MGKYLPKVQSYELTCQTPWPLELNLQNKSYVTDITLKLHGKAVSEKILKCYTLTTWN